jgi:hypothetical protein
VYLGVWQQWQVEVACGTDGFDLLAHSGVLYRAQFAGTEHLAHLRLRHTKDRFEPGGHDGLKLHCELTAVQGKLCTRATIASSPCPVVIARTISGFSAAWWMSLLRRSMASAIRMSRLSDSSRARSALRRAPAGRVSSRESSSASSGVSPSRSPRRRAISRSSVFSSAAAAQTTRRLQQGGVWRSRRAPRSGRSRVGAAQSLLARRGISRRRGYLASRLPGRASHEFGV